MNNTYMMRGTFIVTKIPLVTDEVTVREKCTCGRTFTKREKVVTRRSIGLGIDIWTIGEMIEYAFPYNKDSEYEEVFITGNMYDKSGVDDEKTFRSDGSFEFIEIPLNEEKILVFMESWKDYIREFEEVGMDFEVKYGILLWSEC